MNIRVKRWLVFGSSFMAIVVISMLSRHVVPLYDGVGFPDEPYRYVSPPSAAKKTVAPPGSALNGVAASSGTNASAVTLTSDEQGPQMNVYLSQGALKSASRTKSYIVRVVPQKPNTPTPKGPIAGNIYDLSVASDTKDLVSYNHAGHTLGFMDLRLPQGYTVGATMFYRAKATDNWRALPTNQVGADIYEARLIGFGDYGLVKTVKTNTESGANEVSRALIVLIVVILCGLIILLVIRGRQQHSSKKKSKK